MTYTADILTSTIIAVGDFNPAIFTPDWLEANKLIGKGDADAVRDESQGNQLIVTHRVASFETKWFALQVLENKFTLASKDALSPAFKDLAVGIFQLIPHTPVKAVGLNSQAHFKLASEEEHHLVGDFFAPKDIWNKIYPEMRNGLATLTVLMQPGARGEPLKTNDEKRITLEPSTKFKFGVVLSHNDHHDVTSSIEDNLRPAERVAAVIENSWEPAWKDSIRVFDVLLSMALAKQTKK